MNINEQLQKKAHLKKEMANLKYEIADELGYDNVKILNAGDLSSRSIGIYAGPVGGLITKDLIKRGEEALITQKAKT